MISSYGFIDPPVPDFVLKPVAGISASVNIEGLNIHDNNIHNVRRGIVLNDYVLSASQSSVAISFNTLYDTWEYGIVGFGSGAMGLFDAVGNTVDVDPYLISPGRSGGQGAWAQNYGASSCFSTSYTSTVRMAENTFSDCYTLQTGATWIISKNILRGYPFAPPPFERGQRRLPVGVTRDHQSST